MGPPLDDYIKGWAFSVIPVYVAKDLSHYFGRGPISGTLVYLSGNLYEFAVDVFMMIYPDYDDPGVPILVRHEDLDD